MARVLMFGRLQDVAGWRERSVQAGCLSDLRALLTEADPELGRQIDVPGVFAVVDQVLTRTDVPLSADSEVAFIPPVSGG